MKLVNRKINLCFEYSIKSNNKEEIIITSKTHQREIIMHSEKDCKWINMIFNNAVIQFNDINIEEGIVKIFIEMDGTRLIYLQSKQNVHFSFNLSDIKNKDNILLKISDYFTLTFNFSFNLCNNDNDNDNEKDNYNDKRRMSFESIASIDSNLESYITEDFSESKEDKIQNISKANDLFGRLKGVTKIIKLKNFRVDEVINNMNRDSNKNEEEKSKEKKKDVKFNKDVEMLKLKKNETQKLFKVKLNKTKSLPNNYEENEPLNIINFEEIKVLRKPKNIQRKKRLLKFEEKEDFDNILSSTDYESFLKEQNYLKKNKKEQSIRETFCCGFFITSIPLENPIINENSDKFPASCSHKPCSILNSMQPQILMRYPLEDTESVEITNLSATLCFPSGIKLCYCDPNKTPKKMDDYLTLMTNRKGERLYIMTYHFYVKMDKSEFDKKSKNNSLDLKLKQIDEKIKTINVNEIDQDAYNFFEELKTCKEFEYRSSIYIPYCLALISKYPYINEMKKSITCIFKIIENQINNDKLELNELLMYLIHSIPIPNINTNIEFPLPYYETKNKNDYMITLEPLKYKDMNILNSNFSEIVKIFRIKNIIRIFRLLLFEKKILFIDNDYTRLTDIMNCFLSLIYPFQWTHVYIPILSIPMMKYLETFLPFLVGVHSSFLPYIKKHLINNSNEKDQVYLIFVEEDKIKISDSLKGNNKQLNKTRFLHEDLTNLPVWMYYSLAHLLLNIKMKMKCIKNEDFLAFNFEIQNAFIEIFIEMFSDYNKYIYRVGDETIFNKNAFLSKKNLLEKKFYKDFLDTQMFLQFKEEILNDGKDYFKSKISERNNENKEKLKQTTLEKTRTNIFEYPEDKKKYKIKHKFKNMIKKESNSYKEDNYIINNFKKIDDEKYDRSKCIIYLMPIYQTIGAMVKDTCIYPNLDDDETKEKKKLTEEERKQENHIYKIEEQIKEYVLKIFKSDKEENDDDSEAILNILKREQKGREYFIKIISKNLSKVVILPKKTFDILNNLILGTLSIYLEQKENADDSFMHAVRLLKSSMNYGKDEKNKIITIWDLCHEKLKSIHFIHEDKFWDEWYIFEINNNINLNGTLLNTVKNQVMISISKTMKEIGIDQSKIYLYTDNLMSKYFGKDLDLIQKTQKDIKKYINENSKV